MLLIRNPFSHTKKFFQKTLRNFRSLFTCDTYQFQKLPKSATCCHVSFPCTNRNAIDFNPPGLEADQYQELDKFYTDFSRKWDAVDKGKGKRRRRAEKKETVNVPSSIVPNQKVEDQSREVKRSDDRIQYRSNSSTANRSLVPAKKVGGTREYSASKREARSVVVAEKLKELEMMDMGDMDQVLDIEEVIHYYSRLTCPAYLEIIDKFFMDMYAEFTGQRNVPATVSIGSRGKFLFTRK